MTTTTMPTVGEPRLALDDIRVCENIRDLDIEHVEHLARSIALRGLLVPLIVRVVDDGHELVAGYHRVAACRKLGLTDAPVVIRDHEGSSADSAAENVNRKQLNPVEPGTVALDATFVGSGDAGSGWIAARRAAARTSAWGVSLSCKGRGLGELSGSDATLLR